jgi:hypothetical protein
VVCRILQLLVLVCCHFIYPLQTTTGSFGDCGVMLHLATFFFRSTRNNAVIAPQLVCTSCHASSCVPRYCTSQLLIFFFSCPVTMRGSLARRLLSITRSESA